MSGILIDTCIWSLALRNKQSKNQLIAEQLAHFIDQHSAKIIGVIRQEVLSGYSNKNSFNKLRQQLSYFPNEATIDADYEAAAEYSNFCRTKGIQGSHIDFLICAVAIRKTFKIYTVDKDFIFYSKHLPISLH